VSKAARERSDAEGNKKVVGVGTMRLCSGSHSRYYERQWKGWLGDAYLG
jgi:hypothetical protein